MTFKIQSKKKKKFWERDINHKTNHKNWKGLGEKNKKRLLMAE